MEADPLLAKRVAEYNIKPETDVNIQAALNRLKQFKTKDYLKLKNDKAPRKTTDYDHHLLLYPYKDKQLHEDHMRDPAGGHYDREAPYLDDILLTQETTENVFRKNHDAAAVTVEKCITEAFFAREIEGRLCISVSNGCYQIV